MKRILFLCTVALFLVIACGNDNAASDNTNLPDSAVAADTTGAAEADAALPDTSLTDTAVTADADDPAADTQIPDDETADELITDEKGEGSGGGDKDSAGNPDSDVITDPAACCVEVVKEWWRCDGYKTDQADACTACVGALAACSDFKPKDANWSCAASCNDICAPGTVKENDDTVGKGLGKSRRAIADQYCKWMVDTTCSYKPDDFTGLGSTDPLKQCF